jgi:post-segregation antitoxin (ccd killing protein)
MPKAVITASVNLEIASQIAAEARERGWSVSEIVNRALAEYVARKSKQSSERSQRIATVQSDSRAK